MYHHKTGIYLRPVERQDLDELKELKRESWWGTANVTLATDESQEEWLTSVSKSPNDLFMAILDEKQNLAGVTCYTNINWINGTCWGAGHVLKDYRKSEIVTNLWYAGMDFIFEIFNIRKLQGEILVTNKGSLAVTLATGFHVEGIRKKEVFRCGKYIDVFMVAMFRDEWKNLERVKSYGECCNQNMEFKDNESYVEFFRKAGQIIPDGFKCWEPA